MPQTDPSETAAYSAPGGGGGVSLPDLRSPRNRICLCSAFLSRPMQVAEELLLAVGAVDGEEVVDSFGRR